LTYFRKLSTLMGDLSGQSSALIVPAEVTMATMGFVPAGRLSVATDGVPAEGWAVTAGNWPA
jgi:hypothetical protein